MRNQPITGVRAKDGSRAGQEDSRRRRSGRLVEDRRRRRPNTTMRRGRRAVIVGTAQLDRRGRRRVAERGRFVILSRTSPNPRGSPGRSVAPKAEEDGEEVTRRKMSPSLNRTSSVTWRARKEGGGKEDPTLEAVQRGDFLELKARASSAFDHI